jgi:hypothetical protein
VECSQKELYTDASSTLKEITIKNQVRKDNFLKNSVLAGHQWLIPVILATQEAEQEDQNLKPTRANSLGNPILKIPNTKKSWWSASSGGASV